MSWMIVLSAGCHPGLKTPSTPLPGSELQYGVSYFQGSSGADVNSLRIEDSRGLTVTVVALSQWHENTLKPVASQTRMITVLPASTAVAAVPRLMREARVGIIPSRTQFWGQIAVRGSEAPLPMERLRGILPNGVGAVFRIAERPTSDSSAIRMLEIQMRRRSATDGPEPNVPAIRQRRISLEVSFVATGHLKPAAGGPEADDSGKTQGSSTPDWSAAGGLTTETIVLTPQDMQEQDRLAVVLPSPFEVAGLVGFAVLIEVESPPPEGTAEAAAYAALWKQCQDKLLVAPGADDEDNGPPFDAGRRGIEDALRLLPSPTHRQRALLYLAQETAAPLLEDVTLSATDIVVDHLAHAVTNECTSGPTFETAALAWRLERTAYRLLVKLLSADQSATGGPDLEAIVVRHAGEVGRHPSVLQEMVSEATSIEDLEQRLLLENFIYLEDISPAARTRAFEWLAARGRAPEGYDPLASLKERRSVLNRVLQEQP